MNFSQQRTASTVLALIGLLSFLIVLAGLPSAFAAGGEEKGPTADAGGPYKTHEGGHIDLNGAKSSGNIGSFSWRILSLEMKGESCKLANKVGELRNKDSPTPIFDVAPEFSTKCDPEVYVEPDKEVEVKVKLTVSGPNGSDSDVATIRISNGGGDDVIADAGGLYTVVAGSTVELDGSDSSEPDIGTDPEGIDGYSWRVMDGPGILTDSESAKAIYLAPENTPSGSVATIQLKVNDDDGSDTDTARVVIEASPKENHQSVRNSIEDNLHTVDKRSNPPVRPSYTFDNASLDVHVLVEENGYVTADASFHMEKKVQATSASFAQIPLKSGEFRVRAKRVGDNLVKANADVRVTLVEDKLGTKAKFALSYLSNLGVEDINEKYAPKIENLYSKLRRMIKAQVRTSRKAPENIRRTLENTKLPRLKKFRLTSFSWDSPKLKVSATAEFDHHSFKKKIDLPMGLNASFNMDERSIEANANFSATPKGPGLENAGFSLSVSREDNLMLLNASATAEGKMPKRDNMYVVDLSRYAKGVGKGKFRQLENVELPNDFHTTLELEVSKGLRVENQPSVPSYCKTGKCRTYVWENRKALTAATSLLSGKSSFAVKSVPKEKTQTTFPYVYVFLGIGIATAVAATSVAYWKSSQERGK